MRFGIELQPRRVAKHRSKRSDARRANKDVAGGVIVQATGMRDLVNITIAAEVS